MLSPSAWRTAWSEMASTNGCTKGAGTPWGRAASHMDLIPHETASDTEQPIFVLTETSHLIQHLRCNSSARFPPCRKLCAWPPYNKWPGAILRLESWQAETQVIRGQIQGTTSRILRVQVSVQYFFLQIVFNHPIYLIYLIYLFCLNLLFLSYLPYLFILSILPILPILCILPILSYLYSLSCLSYLCYLLFSTLSTLLILSIFSI